MMNDALPTSFSMDLSYVTATYHFGDDAPVYRGPVVFTIDGQTFVDMWLGSDLEGYESPELTAEFWSDVVSDIQLALEKRGEAYTGGEYRRAYTREEVRAELNAAEMAAAQEEARLVSEGVCGEMRRAA